MAEGTFRQREHLVSLVDRQKLTVSGVEQVASFDEEEVVLATDLGNLTIRGRELRIQQLNLEDGSFAVEGTLSSLSYTEGRGRRARGGGWRRFFR
ncbi:MAG: sporulation protein YabP [Thermaerobacter sp.]|jgi:sporulation protein YabP|nr:sporulation protein YabP [Thermaerobacter sp.]MDA8145638.1 sporulation protein YabP [Thermaerobacter sp.]